MSAKLAKKEESAKAIYRILTKRYPNVRCELDFMNPLQLLVATVLSAQCTDKRVNAVTPALFKRYKIVEDFAGANLRELQTIIKSTGFYRAKAKNIKGLAIKIVKDYGGEVPDKLEELVKLPGVGRKRQMLFWDMHLIPRALPSTLTSADLAGDLVGLKRPIR